MRASDPAGNVDPAPAARTFTVDTVPPRVTITSGPEGAVSRTNALFEFTADEPAGFACSLDGAPASLCSGSVTYVGLAQGSHTFSVVATDRAGNAGTPATRAWTADTVPPVVTITSGPTGTVRTPDAAIGFVSDEPATFLCGIDAGELEACVSPQTYTGLGDGDHTFRVLGIDQAGNTTPQPAVRSWRIDTGPPETSITAAPPPFTQETTATIAFTSDEPDATFTCSLDGGAFVECLSSSVTYRGLPQGRHTFAVRAKDPEGNTDPTPAETSWVVDNSAPVVAIQSPERGDVVVEGETLAATGVPLTPVVVGSVVVRATASDDQSGVQTVEFSVEGGPWTPGVSDPSTGTWTYRYDPGGEPGLRTVIARARNRSELEAEASVRLFVLPT